MRWICVEEFTAHVFGKTKVQDALKKLDAVITEEHLLMTATILDAVQRGECNSLIWATIITLLFLTR